MTEVISVRFRGGCKNYDFDPKGMQVKMGDQVIVETAQGPEFGTCTQGNHDIADEAVVQPLCAVLRLATDADRRTVEYNRKKESDAFDLVWSDKVGYVLLDISPDYNYVDTARRIDTAAELCRLMLEDVALDVLLLTENEHSIETADPLERAEIVRRWQPYFEQLPEYEYLREELTSEWP